MDRQMNLYSQKNQNGEKTDEQNKLRGRKLFHPLQPVPEQNITNFNFPRNFYENKLM
jgi:hypothetical protein